MSSKILYVISKNWHVPSLNIGRFAASVVCLNFHHEYKCLFVHDLLISCYFRMWAVPEAKGISRSTRIEDEKLKLVAEGCNPRVVSVMKLPITLYLLKNMTHFNLSIIYSICWACLFSQSF